MQNLCLTAARFAIASWVGAACLFVVIMLQDVQSPDLSSIEKARIAVQRFPIYYRFAFGLLIPAFLLTGIGTTNSGGKRRWTIRVLMLLPLPLITTDYFWVYLPLEEMTAATNQARPARFIAYHQASMWINAVQVSASFIAAVGICWPSARRIERTTPGHRSTS